MTTCSQCGYIPENQLTCRCDNYKLEKNIQITDEERLDWLEDNFKYLFWIAQTNQPALPHFKEFLPLVNKPRTEKSKTFREIIDYFFRNKRSSKMKLPEHIEVAPIPAIAVLDTTIVYDRNNKAFWVDIILKGDGSVVWKKRNIESKKNKILKQNSQKNKIPKKKLAKETESGD